MLSREKVLGVITRARKLTYSQLLKEENAELRIQIEELFGLNKTIEENKDHEYKAMYGVTYEEYRLFESEIIKIRSSGISLFKQFAMEMDALKRHNIKENPPELQQTLLEQYRPPKPLHNRTPIEELYRKIISRNDFQKRPDSVREAIYNRNANRLKLSTLFEPEFNKVRDKLPPPEPIRSTVMRGNQVADLLIRLGISNSHLTVDKWLEKQEIKFHKSGKYRNVQKQDLIEFISSKNVIFEKVAKLILDEDNKLLLVENLEKEISLINLQIDGEENKGVRHNLYQRKGQLEGKIERLLQSRKDKINLSDLKKSLGEELFL